MFFYFSNLSLNYSMSYNKVHFKDVTWDWERLFIYNCKFISRQSHVQWKWLELKTKLT